MQPVALQWRSLSLLCETAPTPAGRRVPARSARTCMCRISCTRSPPAQTRARTRLSVAFAEYTLVIFLRAHRFAFARALEYQIERARVRLYTGRRSCMCEQGIGALRGWREREEERERERERRGEYFVRFRSTGCNGGEPHCWPVSRPRLLGRRQRRRRRWWRRWWSRRTSCRRTACLKGRAVLLAASTHTIPPRACALRFACHRGERGVNFNTITPSQPRVNKT